MGKRRNVKPGKSNGKGLQSSLLRHQALEKQNKATSLKITKNDTTKPSLPKKARLNQALQIANSKKFIPFSPKNTVLLVGEGDFSFAVSLINQGYIDPANLIITSFDNSVNELKLKYPKTFEDNYNELINIHNVTKIFFKIDATNLIKTFKISPKNVLKVLGVSSIDYIMFNFPHTGRGMKDQDRNIRDHQLLILGYLKSCTELFQLIEKTNSKSATALSSLNVLKPIDSGTNEPKIILSVFEGEPYDSWNIKSLSKTVGLKVERSGAFDWSLFPEYHHRRTNSEQDTTKKASERKARIYVFEKFKKDERKRKTGDDESDSDE